MTTSLFKEIECLNKDIDKCKTRLDNYASKKTCPPNCYCDKQRKGMDCKNVSATRRKTASATVTKMDIAPRLYQERENSRSIRPKTDVSDDYLDEESNEYPCCSKKSHSTYDNVRNSRDDMYSFMENYTEPVKLPKKCPKIKNEPSWGSILQQNNRRDMIENVNNNFKVRKNEFVQVNSSSSNSVSSSGNLENKTIYVKNKKIQCDELSFQRKKYTDCDDPLNTIQYLIMSMKSKLGGDPNLGGMLDEMEAMLHRIPLDRGDSKAVGDDYRNNSLDKYLHPRPNFNHQKKIISRDRLEVVYLELEASCKRLKQERDNAVEKASQKSAELVDSMKREVETKAKLNETNSKIKQMSTKLETYTKSMEGLTEHVKRLQNENKEMERIRGQVAQLSSMMRDVSQENKTLLSELQMITIERNKLEVALGIKEQELEKKIKELETITLMLEKSKKIRLSMEKNKQDRSNHKKIFDTQSPRKSDGSPQLVSSSPNTSSLNCSLVNEKLNSWIAVSAITTPDEIQTVEDHRNDDLNLLKHKEIESIKLPENNKIIQKSTEVQTNKIIKTEKKPNMNKIEKLKEEIRRMFTEMRELAVDVPPIPVVELSSLAGQSSSDLNWSEMSNTANSCESLSDFHSSEFNEFINKNKMNY